MNTELIKSLIKKALSEEIQAFYAYMVPVEFLQGVEFATISQLSRDLAADELFDHFSNLLKRLAELNGSIEDIPTIQSLLEKSVEQGPIAVTSTTDFIRINIQAEKDAIRTYRELILIAKAEEDFATEQLAKRILTDEEKHLSKLTDYLSVLGEAAKAELPSQVNKATKGSSGYDEWLRKYREKRAAAAESSKQLLEQARDILENGDTFEKDIDGKKLTVTDDGDNYNLTFDGETTKYDSSHGVVTARLEEKLLRIFESRKNK